MVKFGNFQASLPLLEETAPVAEKLERSASAGKFSLSLEGIPRRQTVLFFII